MDIPQQAVLLINFDRATGRFSPLTGLEIIDFFGEDLVVQSINDLIEFVTSHDRSLVTDFFSMDTIEQNHFIKFGLVTSHKIIEEYLVISLETFKTGEKLLFIRINQIQALINDRNDFSSKLIDILGETGLKLSGLSDFHSVLDQLLIEIKKLIPFDSANLMMIENNTFVIKHKIGYENYKNHPLNNKITNWVFNILDLKNLAYIVNTLNPLLIADTQTNADWLEIKGTEEIKSWIGVPIISQNHIIGIISLDKTEPNFFNHHHEEILMSFAGQASLAMQNALHFQELNLILSRDQKLNQLVHLISKTLDIEIIAKSVCNIIAEIFDCSATSVVIQNAENEYISYRSFYDETGNNIDNNIIKVTNLGIAQDILNENRPIYLDDYSQYGMANTFWIDAGFKTFIGIPISIGNSVIGAIGLFHKVKSKKYSENDIHLLESISRQTFIAIQNARLYESEKISRKNAEALREATSAITSALNLDQVLDRVLVFLEHVVPYDSATIFLIEKDIIKAVAGRGLPNPELVINKNFPLNNQLFFEAGKTKKPVILINAQLDPRFQQWGAALYIAGWMGIPIIWRDQVIGMLTIDSVTPNAYNTQHASIAQAYANQAAIVIQNSKLFEKTRSLSITDPLTNLYNRRYFFEIAQLEFEKSINSKLPFSIIIVDLNNFKSINDTFGHLAGDHTLIEIANTIRETLREDDLICRFGGDEFIALVRLLDEESTRKIVERLERKIKEIKIPQKQINISASIGFSGFNENIKTLDEIINTADKMLYIKKNDFKKSSN